MIIMHYVFLNQKLILQTNCFQGYLIASHLDKDDQLDVHAFLRLNDLLDLTVTSAIESLVIWQEVFMTSCSYCIEGSRTFLSNKRWFLLIIGQVN